MDREDLIAEIDQAWLDGNMDDQSFRELVLDFLDIDELAKFVQYLKDRGAIPSGESDFDDDDDDDDDPDDDDDDDDPYTKKVLERGYF
jgi:hypothetical protein